MMKRILTLLCICCITTPSIAQFNFNAGMLSRALNAKPPVVIFNLHLNNTRKGNAISQVKVSSSDQYVSASAKENIEKVGSYAIIAANKKMTVHYGIPLRANKDIDVLEFALERQIPSYQKSKDDYTNLAANALLNHNYNLANEYQRRVNYYVYKINQMQGMMDQIVKGRNKGDLILRLHKPPSIKADFRYIDPITDIPIAPADKSEDLAGGYKVLIDFIQWDVIQNLPISRTITIYKKN